MIDQHLHRFRKAYAAFTGIGLGFCIAIVGLITYDTAFHDQGDYITMHDGVAIGYPATDGTLNVRYQRGFTVHHYAVGDMHRRVVCRCAKTGVIEEYDFPPVRREFAVGEYPADGEPVPMRFLDTPISVPVGSQCELSVGVIWRPRFAIASRMTHLDSFKFTVQEKP